MIRPRDLFVKQRPRPTAGSIPDLLQMFEREVRFYREVAAHAGIRVPRCHAAEWNAAGTRLVLEDLSRWRDGGDPQSIAAELAALHRRWEGEAELRWPWLPRGGRAAAVAIGRLYDRTWSEVAERYDLAARVRRAGSSLVGKTAAPDLDERRSDSRTLIHGDASLRNIRTSPDGVLAFLDWEDVRSANGCVDLAWLLVSSVEPNQWDGVVEAYGAGHGQLGSALRGAFVQGVLSLADHEAGSGEASAWLRRLEAAADYAALEGVRG